MRVNLYCKILVEAKANINAKDFEEETPLHDAVCNGSEACVRILLAARAQVDLMNDDGYTALAHAIELNEHDCAEVLLCAGAKIQNVNVRIPEWMNDIVIKFNNFKAAYTVLYGILRRRMDIPFLFNPKAANPTPMMLLICAVLLKTRFDEGWEE